MPHPNLTVLTLNLYLGADLAPVLAASPEQVPERWSAVWAQVRASDFPARARKLAELIVGQEADLICLQEVYRWSTVARLSPTAGAPELGVAIDFLATLLAELAARGQSWFCAVQSPGVYVQLPTLEGVDVRMEDSVALLIRARPDSPLRDWSRPRRGSFAKTLAPGLDGEPFRIARGWASVDLLLPGGWLRVVTTHLEYYGKGVKPGQVRELLAGPLAGDQPAILAGDFNAKPTDSIARTLRKAGFQDAWSAAEEGGKGFTSSQDGDLANLGCKLYERIDWILVRGGIEALGAARLGHRPEDRTPSGLWPSDHAAVVARLRLPDEPA